MSLQDVANDIKQALETGVLSPFCKDGNFPPMQTIQNVFWDKYTSNNHVAYECFYNAIEVLCDQGYLKYSGDWYSFV